MPELTTERLLLRHVTPDDAPFVLALLNSPGWLTYIGDRRVRTEAQATTYITDRMLGAYATPGHGSFVATDRATGKPLGVVGVYVRDYLQAPDFGYAFLPAYHGRGYALEAARAVLAQPEVVALPSLLAIVMPDNARSIHLLARLGFSRTGTTENEEGVLLECYARAT